MDIIERFKKKKAALSPERYINIYEKKNRAKKKLNSNILFFFLL